MNKKVYIIISIIFIALLGICTYSNIFQKGEKNANNNLAKVEIYSANDNELLKVISDKKILENYNNNFSFYEDYEENQDSLKDSVHNLKEQYKFVSYKAPVAKYGSKELEENTIITLFENSNIIKMTVSNDSIKSFSLPEEFLTFYYNISNEDLQFFYSLIEE